MKPIIKAVVLARTAATGIITVACFANLPPVQAQVRLPDTYPYVTSRPHHPGLYDERERAERRREERLYDELRRQRDQDVLDRYSEGRQQERDAYWRDYINRDGR